MEEEFEDVVIEYYHEIQEEIEYEEEFEDNDELIGIIYKITNLVNDKIYIGKTKEFYGINVPYGIESRFKKHICDAKGHRGCPLLGNAIRKHGEENFIIEKLKNCKLEDVDDNEVALIKHYDATNKDIGYNIALGGKGRSVVHVEESARRNISSRLKLDKDAEININPVNRDEKLVGYSARRREKGKHVQKWFTSTENTPEENLKLARDWMKHYVETGEQLETNKRELPDNVCPVIENGKTLGYRVDMQIKGTKYTRVFSSSEFTMEEKLEQAIKYKTDILNGNDTTKENINSKHKELPKNVNIAKNKAGKIIGYTGKVIINKVPHVKMFIKVSVPMEEKLKQATDYVNSILNK